ncbi:MAG: YitT family protein [Granulosicoccus sp.]
MSDDKQRTNIDHRWHDDVQAMLIGTVFVAIGVIMYRHAGLLTGGTAGLAFLAMYASHIDFSVAFFAINLPFYVFAWLRMGPVFTVKTFAAVTILSLLVFYLPSVISFERLQPAAAAVIGGMLIGSGMLILFRHKSSLGGLNIAVLYLQERFGLSAGKIQLVLDCLIVLAALAVTDWGRVALSVIGATVMNLTLAINHRKGRYQAV